MHTLDETARLGTVVQLRLGFGAVAVRMPCRVIDVFDEANREGLTYATPPGHHEANSERLLLERADNGSLRLSMTAISAPASLPGRFARPGALCEVASRAVTVPGQVGR